jgi:phosphomannomutase
LQFVSEQNKTLSEIIAPHQKYFHSGEINFVVENKEAKMNELANHYSDGQVSFLDGVSIDYSDWWFNVRPSNTESLLRLNLEARTKELLVEKVEEVKKIIEKE